MYPPVPLLLQCVSCSPSSVSVLLLTLRDASCISILVVASAAAAAAAVSLSATRLSQCSIHDVVTSSVGGALTGDSGCRNLPMIPQSTPCQLSPHLIRWYID
jgi:hypothetical protein